MKLLCQQQLNPIVVLGFCYGRDENVLEGRGAVGSVFHPVTDLIFDLWQLILLLYSPLSFSFVYSGCSQQGLQRLWEIHLRHHVNVILRLG